VVGVSTDPQETSDRFRASLDLPYPVVGDPHATLGRVYRVTWPLIKRFQRVTYLIARNRTVRLAFHDELHFAAHAEQACAAVAGGALAEG
jgi:peroxiredoxin